jgi:hypothetical protein
MDAKIIYTTETFDNMPLIMVVILLNGLRSLTNQ